MIIKNIRTFIRHLVKNKVYTFVTVLGFAISLTFVVLLGVYIKSELSVNKHHKNKHRIYRLSNELYATTAPAIGEYLQNKFPEIESYTRIYRNDAIIVTEDDQKLKMNFMMADSTFFTMFSFKLLEGTSSDALKTKHSVVLTKSFANKLFGNEPALGKTIKLRGYIAVTVGGVVEDISKNSSFEACDAIVNFRLLATLWEWPDMLSSFGNCSFGTFVMAKENSNLPAKIPYITKAFKQDFWIYRDSRVKEVLLEPLDQVYFSKTPGPSQHSNSKTLIMVLSAIVVLILVLALINYINLTIAQAGVRIKESAIKKLIGSSRNKLMQQHISESVLLCLIAFSIAILLSFALESVFNNLLDTNISIANQLDITTILITTLGIFLLGIISGLIPSAVITRFNAISVIKGSFSALGKTKHSQYLIGFQFLVVIILLVSTLTITKQANFLQQKDLGFNYTNILWFDSNTNLTGDTGLKNKFMQIAGVKNVSFVQGSPIDGGNNQSFKIDGQPVSYQEFLVDSAFFEMMKFKVSPSGSVDKKGVFLNETAVKSLAKGDMPQEFEYRGTKIPVLGIVNDFNYRNVKYKPDPVMIRYLSKNDFPWNVLIEVESSSLSTVIGEIEKAYADYTGGWPMELHFMDDSVGKWFAGEKRTSKIIGYFAILTIIIAAMGVFAMSLFFIQQRIKEIGIRKVNGAKVSEIVKMLNKDFVKWVVIAFVLATPCAYLVMNKWLSGFAYKTNLNWWIFALSGFFALSIALLTVSWQTFAAARRNPVEALRYE